MSEFQTDQANAAKGPCDCGCPECGDSTVKPAVAETVPDNSRRKLLFGGVVATPAITLLSSRSALAGLAACTASAHASVNLSRPAATNCKSLSPGCWKNTLAWPAPFKPGLPDPNTGWDKQFTVTDANLKSYFKDVAKCSNDDTTLTNMIVSFRAKNTVATLCTSYFPWAPSGQSFMQALRANGGGNTALLRHAIAAALNAAQFGPVDFGYTVAELVAMVNSRFGKDSQLAADLDYLGNDRGSASCPGAASAGQINWCTILNT